MKFLGPSSRPRLNEAAAIVFLLAGLWLLFALISYYPLDVSFNTAAKAGKAANLVGRYGAYLADGLLQLLGIAAFSIPVGLFCLGWKWLRSSPIDAPVVRVLGFLLLAGGLSAASGMLPDWKPLNHVIPAGGLAGMLLAGALVERFNELGASLITVGAVALSVYLVSSFEMAVLAAWFAAPLTWMGRIASRFSAWREHRAMLAAKRRQARAAAAAAEARPKPVRARAAAAAAGAGAGPAMLEDPLSHAGAFPVVAARAPFLDEPRFEAPPPIIEERTLPEEQEEDVEVEEFDDAPQVIPIRAIEEVEREEIKARRVAAMPPPPESSVKSRRKTYVLPPTDILKEPPVREGYDSHELHETASRIKAKFEEFNVLGNVVQINPGPVVTTFEFKPDAGIKYSRITSLQEDLCLGLQAESILIERIPGKPTVGIEVPNTRREVIALREVLESQEFHDSPSRLTIALGKDISGKIKVAALESMPHCLIAGSTGSGKSVMLNTLIMSVLYKSTPDEVRMILVDPKRLEMGLYEGVPHLLTPVITDPKKATNALRNAVLEMERRLKLLAIQGVRNIDQYNKKVKALMNQPRSLFGDEAEEQNREEELRPLPYVLIIIDELADLMMLERAGVEESVTRLAQMARAVGMHLVLATQRPSVDVITGLIKANFPSRISFRVATRVDSRTVLDVMGAEHLLGKGDMLYLPPGSSRLVRIHGSFVSETETNDLVEYWKKQAEPDYDKSYLMAPPSEDEDGMVGGGEDGEEMSSGEEDPVYQDAVRVVVDMGKASTSILQRRLRLGYGRAARILDMMQRDGIIGPPDGSRPREVLKRPDWLSEVESLP